MSESDAILKHPYWTNNGLVHTNTPQAGWVVDLAQWGWPYRRTMVTSRQ